MGVEMQLPGSYSCGWLSPEQTHAVSRAQDSLARRPVLAEWQWWGRAELHRAGASFTFLRGRCFCGALAAVRVERAGVCRATRSFSGSHFPQAMHPPWEGRSLASPWQLLGDGHTVGQVGDFPQPTFGLLFALPGFIPETQP